MQVTERGSGQPIRMAPDAVAKVFAQIEHLADQLHITTESLQADLGHASSGDPRHYLSGGINTGYGALFQARQAESELRELLCRARMTMTRFVETDTEEAVERPAAICPAAEVIGGHSEEGLKSFVTGAVFGEFSDNDSWSAMAGQVVIGFVPVAGQLADLRDIIAAGKKVWEGEEGAWLALGISAAAIVPGLDFLKGGSKAGRKVLAEVAQQGLSDVATEGLQQLSKQLSKESLERASKELITLWVAREELIVRLDIMEQSPFISSNSRRLLEKARNSLKKHLDQEDLVGALRDQHRVPVVIQGKAYQHIIEVRDGITSLINAKRKLKTYLSRTTPGTEAYRQISQEVEALSEIIRRYQQFLEIK